MSIWPIDIMKSQEASQLKHVESHRNQHEQIQLNKSFQDLIQADNSRTVKAEKSENSEYRYDAKEKGKNSYHGSPDRRNKGTDKDKDDIDKKNGTLGQGKTGRIDILI